MLVAFCGSIRRYFGIQALLRSSEVCLRGSLEDSLEAIPASWSEDRGSDEVSTVLLAVFEAETPGVTFVVVALSTVDPAVTVGLDGVNRRNRRCVVDAESPAFDLT